MKCVYCGTVLRRQSNFCLGCGKPVNAMECYIAEMKESGKVLTRKTDKESLNRIIDYTGKIFERTHLNPELKYEVRDFFESYLPKITEVLSRYKDAKGHSGMDEQIKAIKNDLTEVLDSTEEAFILMHQYLCENDIMELKINIEALKAQIARDGLLKSEFDIK